MSREQRDSWSDSAEIVEYTEALEDEREWPEMCAWPCPAALAEAEA